MAEVIETNVSGAQTEGKIAFANDVIATIAALAATEVEGVAGMSGGMVDGIVDLLGRKNLTKGIKVEVGNEEAAIDVYVVITYGSRIHEVAQNIQRNVQQAVESMTGLKVVEANVHVQGVYLEKDMPEPDQPRVR